eukprot:3096318-Rhodomonas_salina.1
MPASLVGVVTRCMGRAKGPRKRSEGGEGSIEPWLQLVLCSELGWRIGLGREEVRFPESQVTLETTR